VNSHIGKHLNCKIVTEYLCFIFRGIIICALKQWMIYIKAVFWNVYWCAWQTLSARYGQL